MGALTTYAVTGVVSGAIGNFSPIVASLVGMYSAVVQNVSNGEETTALDLLAGGGSVLLGNLAGTTLANHLIKDSVKGVGAFDLVVESSTLEITETSITMGSSTTVINGLILQTTPAVSTAAYNIVQTTVEATVGQVIDFGLKQASIQSNSDSYYQHKTRGLLFDADW